MNAATPRTCTYCGTVHSYSADMCRDLVRDAVLSEKDRVIAEKEAALLKMMGQKNYYKERACCDPENGWGHTVDCIRENLRRTEAQVKSLLKVAAENIEDREKAEAALKLVKEDNAQLLAQADAEAFQVSNLQAALKKAEGEVASLKEELQAVNDIQDCPGGDCLTYTELALEVSRVVIRAESAETKLEAVRELLPRIEAWIKKPVCGCAPMHNDGDCLEHQILPLLKKILPEKEYECEHCHKKSPASLWIADECPICKTYNMPF